jgi:hypothetical protein
MSGSDYLVEVATSRKTRTMKTPPMMTVEVFKRVTENHFIKTADHKTNPVFCYFVGEDMVSLRRPDEAKSASDGGWYIIFVIALAAMDRNLHLSITRLMDKLAANVWGTGSNATMRASGRWFTNHLEHSSARHVDTICQAIHREFYELSHEQPSPDGFALLETSRHSSKADNSVTCEPWPIEIALEKCEYNNKGTRVQLAAVIIVPQSEIQKDGKGYDSCPRLNRRLRAKLVGIFTDLSFPCFLVFDFGCGKNVKEIQLNLAVRLAISRYVYSF